MKNKKLNNQLEAVKKLLEINNLSFSNLRNSTRQLIKANIAQLNAVVREANAKSIVAQENFSKQYAELLDAFNTEMDAIETTRNNAVERLKELGKAYQNLEILQ